MPLTPKTRRCRCVDSQRLSNNKQKGRGNECGNRYLAWAYIEAAKPCAPIDTGG